MRILHLSDTHLTAAPGPNADGIDSRESLRGMLADCERLTGLSAVLVTGDIADDGSVSAYADVRALVGGFAQARGIPALYTTGNHDERTAFASVLGDDLVAATDVDGFRLITLDTLVPGKAYGRLGDDQLAWLRRELSTPAANGTVLAFHHPPIALPGVEVQRELGLLDPEALAEAIRGSDVRLILTGHFHLQLFGLLGSVPVWVTPGVITRVDLTGVPGTERAVRGACATLVDLSTPHSPLLHVLHARDPRAGETAHELGAEALSAVIAQLGR
ncbi:phosphohydrolase [Paractinoplanes abujensis]|uniref:3',5'-cyclic AMP phosphodiesterase CpdA n=1 Tax=Paractinoplanes abujensis TaxID=882441 RepID=A0A7W7CN24_9ACTN|nr:metallophosphoesterase [Actinoplanes abujensis]MBB4691561.1 3',5'-cyclic AMP phosphodiesterase CpdA [Actinoplanes abujensis]GID17021.1 phosphohydrolase [Actinoplanes abujensis]